MPTKELAITLENLATMLLMRASGRGRLDQVKGIIQAARNVVGERNGSIAALLYGPDMERAQYLYRVELPWARSYSRLGPYMPHGKVSQETTKALLMAEALMAASRATMAAYMEIRAEAESAELCAAAESELEVIPG